MTRYVDSSVIIQFLTQADPWIDPFEIGEKFIASQLARLECKRTIHRFRIESKYDDETLATFVQALHHIFEKITLVNLTETILDRAEENWGTVVGSLDAIHLASALIYRSKFKEPFQFLTHDKALANAAKIQGFEVIT